MSESQGTSDRPMAGAVSIGHGEKAGSKRPVSKLAVASLALAAGPAVGFCVFWYLLPDAYSPVAVRTMPVLLFVPLALAVAALATGIRRGERRGKFLFLGTFAVTAAYIVGIVAVVAPVLSSFGKEEIDVHVMPGVPWLVLKYGEQTGRPPESIEDLVKAGLLDWTPLCGFDKLRRDDPSVGGSSWVLAPFDDRFFDGFDRSVLLCVYCTAEHQFGRESVIVLGFADGFIYAIKRTVLEEWLRAQQEACRWLDDAFPVAELQQVAATAKGHRGEIARAVLEYRQRPSPGAKTAMGAAEGTAP